MLTRRRFLQAGVAAGAAAGLIPTVRGVPVAAHGAPGTVASGVEPGGIPRFVSPLLVPPRMPLAGRTVVGGGKNVDLYDIEVRQLAQHVLPASLGLPMTTLWGYGSLGKPGTFNAPSFTIEARWRRPVRVRWINGLVNETGGFLPHLLPIDQTLHWANPPGGTAGRDGHGHTADPYLGPVPIVTHVHGAHVPEDSDGYAEAWFLPAANDIPTDYATVGTYYDTFDGAYQARTGAPGWAAGSATYEYPNDQRAATLWYHDHTLGMTRANVYAGPAGFYLLRGGPGDAIVDRRTGRPAIMPGPAPAVGSDPFGTFYEIPLAIQDRSFTAEGQLFYPDNRAFFEGLEPDQLDIPFAPHDACGAPSDIAPIWNPEFFGSTIIVNGQTWPHLRVERRRYRLRLLNGCNSRFLLLQFDDPRIDAWQIGADGGYLDAPVRLNDVPADGIADGTAKVLLSPAERADVIVDFSAVPAGTAVVLRNLAPDSPFGGFPAEPADVLSTGQVMELRVIPRSGSDRTTPPQHLLLPAATPIVAAAPVRRLSLNEEDSRTVTVTVDEEGTVRLVCGDDEGEAFGPAAAKLGTLDDDGYAIPRTWMDTITEHVDQGATETWAFYNFTADAHPIHIHQVQFRVLDRQRLETDDDGTLQPAQPIPGTVRPPEPWELGEKDTVIAYPGEVTRVQATFDLAGLYVWHCHIVEHEDNEMMRPFRVTPA